MTDLHVERAELHRQLIEIRSQRGELTPTAVVDAARGKSHPLHHRFEWDDAVAGEEYRKVQAAELIRSVRVVYGESPEGEERKARAWVSTPTPSGRRTYEPTEEVLADPFRASLLLRELEREVKVLQRKYGHLSEFSEIVNRVAKEGAA